MVEPLDLKTIAHNAGLEIRYAIAASGVDPIQHIPEVDAIIERRLSDYAAEIQRLRAEVERLTQRCAEWAASYGEKCSEFEDAKRREAEAFERAAQIAEAATVQVKHEPFDKYIDEPIPHRGTIASLIRQAGKDGGAG